MTLYAHQRAALDFALPRPATALFMEAGTGKTLVSIRAAEAWSEGNEATPYRVLVVAPLTLLPSWRREWARWGEVAHYFTIQDRTGAIGTLEGPDDPSVDIHVVAVNYERAWRMEEHILAWEPDLVIADEAHRIKHVGAKQSKCMHRIGAATERRLLLTGTPVSQSPLDVFSQFKFLDPSVFGPKWIKFRNCYAEMGGYGGYQVVGYRRLEELAEKVHANAYRVTKAEALDLPPTTDKVIPVPMSPEQRRAYAEMKKHALAVINDVECTAPMAVTQLMRLQQIAGGFVPTDDGSMRQVGDAKLKALRDVAADLLEEGKPVLVFARFTAEVKACLATLMEVAGAAASLDGSTPTDRRGRLVEEFQDGALKALVCQTSVGGVGLTLTAADHAIFYSSDFSLVNYEQARARVHRIGQEKPVTYVHLACERSVDEELLDRLRGKQDLAKMVVDDLREVVRRAVAR